MSSSSSSKPLIDPSIFSSLEASITEDQQVREQLTLIIQRLERAVSKTQGLLSKVHSTPRSKYPELVQFLLPEITTEANIIKELEALASQHPYYKYNGKWSRAVQQAVLTVVYTAWLGGFGSDEGQETQPVVGRLITLEEVGGIFGVTVNVKDQDVFHLTLEEYLLSLPDLTSDLSRLATNSVTMGDFELPLIISAFVKDLFAGFQLLNLKNDILRKRGDAIKYDVKRVEDVVYDLSLRGLIKREMPQ